MEDRVGVANLEFLTRDDAHHIWLIKTSDLVKQRTFAGGGGFGGALLDVNKNVRQTFVGADHVMARRDGLGVQLATSRLELDCPFRGWRALQRHFASDIRRASEMQRAEKGGESDRRKIVFHSFKIEPTRSFFAT